MKQPHYVQCQGEDWQKIRMRVLVRDNFTCQWQALGLTAIEDGCCEAEPENRLRFLQVHHIKHRINGGTHDMSNLITVCRAHHYQIHPHMTRDLRYRDRELSYTMRELPYGKSK